MRTPSAAMRALGVAAVVGLLVTAGCLSGPLGGETTDTTVATERTTTDGTRLTDAGSSTDGTKDPEPSDVRVERADPGHAPDLAAELPDSVACEDGWVSFWGTGDTGRFWQEPGELRTGWTVPANRSILFVAFENATAVGADHVRYEQPVTADGDAVTVNATSGSGLYAVVMVVDVNGNGEYDAGVDRPCEDDTDDGDGTSIAMTDWLWVDWN